MIHPGQVLKLYPSRDARVQRLVAASSVCLQGRPRRARAPIGPPVQWQWPVRGGTATLTSRPNGGQGLTISGRLGEEIRAAAAGRVVYTGSGLLGYGQLVILKHNETYLSAYGHTQSVAIREGDAVGAGQRIATMGAGPQGDADAVLRDPHQRHAEQSAVVAAATTVIVRVAVALSTGRMRRQWPGPRIDISLARTLHGRSQLHRATDQ